MSLSVALAIKVCRDLSPVHTRAVLSLLALAGLGYAATRPVYDLTPAVGVATLLVASLLTVILVAVVLAGYRERRIRA